MNDHAHIFAIDPGSTTGICYKLPDGSVIHSQMPHDEFASLILNWVIHPQSQPDELVVESFILHPSTVKKSREGTHHTIELIGLIRHVAEYCSIPLTLQTPAQGKRVTNEILKEAGLYVPKLAHARDAARHMYLYLAKKGLLT